MKHQPCGKPGCINCRPETKSFNGQADFGANQIILMYEQNKRRAAEQMEGLIRSLEVQQKIREMQNELWNEAMTAESNAKSGDFVDATSFKAGERHAIRQVIKLAIRLATRIILVVTLIAFGLAVFV